MVEAAQGTRLNSKMKIAVTGVSGQLGSVLIQDLVNHGHEIFALNRQNLNLLNFLDSKTKLDQLKPDLIVNCAAFTRVDSAETNVDLAYGVNSIGPTELAKYCKVNKVFLIHISTDSIFSSLTPVINPISGIPNPLNVYAKSKLSGEIGIRREYPEGSTIIRTAWLYGKTSVNFVKAILSKGKKNVPFKVVNDQFGQPTYAASLSNFICYLIESRVKSGVFHFSSRDFVSRYDFAREILNLANLKSDIVLPTPTYQSIGLAERPKYSLLDVNPESVNNYPDVSNWKSGLVEFFKEYNLTND